MTTVAILFALFGIAPFIIGYAIHRCSNGRGSK